MKLVAIEFEQHGKKMYSVVFKAEDFLDENKFKVDTWSPNNPTGYQRHLAPGRARKFAEFLLNQKNVSPTSVLLAVRTEPKFRPFSPKLPIGELEFSDETVFYIVDGQHRIGGIREIYKKGGNVSFSVPAIIIYYRFLQEEDPAYCEAKQFVIINQTQKRVRADLHDRFLSRLTPEQRREIEMIVPSEVVELTARAVAIADLLNEKTNSPWKGAIKAPEVQKAPGIISQRSITQSIIRSFLEDRIITDSLDDIELANVIDNWWRAWRKIIPEAFDEQTRAKYVLQTTHVGVRVINELLRTVLNWLIPRREPLTEERFCQIIENMDDGNTPGFWAEDGTASQYRGEGGVRDLLKILEPIVLRAVKHVS
jgi:DGQHR domain-containing protein